MAATLRAASLRRLFQHGRSSVAPLVSRSLSTKADWHALGYVDDRGLTVFDTLHEMQERSCAVFADKDLFGTYNEEIKDFEWMTFDDYANKVHQCRATLQDLGESTTPVLTRRPMRLTLYIIDRYQGILQNWYHFQ